MLALLFQQITGTRPGGRMHAHIGRRLEPGTSLPIEILERMKAAPAKKVILHITDHALDLPLGARTIRSMRLCFKAMVIGKVAETRVHQPRSHDDLAHVVIEDVRGPATKVSKRVLMTADQRLQAHRAGKLEVERPAEPEHHDEKEN